MIGFYNIDYTLKAHLRNVLSILLLTFSSLHMIGQQVWPVQVTGSMIPPRSLDLGVYSFERSQDLVFNATLNDPIQSSLQVQLRLTIESNNQVIYKTDPNFNGPSITLAQFQQLTLDGIALQPYLSPSALVGATNNGMGSLEIPEGFNKICIEVYGIDRNVPISRKFCVQGSFQLNQAPQLSLPTCQSQMEYPETQNLIFNWTPMHLGSSNSPMPVEYQFELVRLPDGYTNANDAFETAMQVYQTTTMTPSLLYSQMEPLLEVDKLYAWRVKAYSMIHPTSKLFQNEGYSEVCTFMYYDEDGPTSGALNDKPAPSGCEVFDTDYGPITSNDLEGINIVEEDIVKLGYFEMLITQAIATGQGFSGTGLVTFPMLRSKVNVNFSGLRVNNDLRVIDAQEIYADVDQQFKLDASEMLPVTIADNVNQNYIEQLDDFFKNGNGINRLVSNLDPAEPQTNNLPIGLDQEDKPTVAIIGINFTPRNAYLNMVSWQDNQGSLLRLAGTTIPSTPFGIKSGAHLISLDGLDVGNAAGTEITPVFSMTYAGSEDSKMDCSCQGYKDMQLEQNLAVSLDIMNEYDNDGIILLKPKTNTDNPETYLGELKDVADFKLVNLPDFEFKPKKAYLDLNQEQSLDKTYPNSEYSAFQVSTWRGLILEDVEVTIPKEYDFTGKNQRITLDKGELFIDENELAYGNLSKDNMLSLEDGKMGNWAYSVEKFGVKIMSGKTAGASMSGNVKVPVFTDLFNYNGTLQSYNKGQIALNVPVSSTELKMDLWKAKFIPTQSSTIDAKLIDVDGSRSFFPKANFDGNLSISMTNEEFGSAIMGNAGQIKSEIQTTLGIKDFDFAMQGVVLSSFKIDPFVMPVDRYTMGSVDLENATVQMDGQELDLGQVELMYESATNEQVGKLGLRTVVIKGNNKIEFTFWANESEAGFVFDGIEVKTVNIQCECTSMIMMPNESQWGSILDEIIEREYAHLFNDNIPSGSLAAFGINEKNEGSLAALRTVLKERLNANHLSGFPMLDDQTINIPFLSKNLEVTSVGGKYQGVSDVTNLDNLTFASVNGSQADKLPIDVSNDLDKLGIKVDNLPSGSKLLITGFETSDDETSWSAAKMQLTLLYEVYNQGGESSYLQFTKSNIPVGPSSVDFTGLYMHLQNDGVNGDNDEIIYKVGDGSSDLSTGSFAYMNCTKGFEYFNVQGIYKAGFSTTAGNTTNKIIHRLSTPVNGQGAVAAQFGFTINNSEGLSYFIAPLNKKFDDSKDWSFSVSGVEQLIFHPGENFEAFIDFDDEDSHSDQPSIANVNGGNVPEFMGLIFKDIEVEVDGLKRANGEALTFDISDVVFDADRGVQASLSISNPVTRQENALFGGWKYDMTSFAFSISANKLSSDGVAVIGSVLPPILDGAPPVSNAVTFEKGWVGYKGTIDFDASGDVYQPDATLEVDAVEDKLFHSSFIPGFGLELNEDSNIGMNYNSGNKEFEASLDFSGNAGIYLSQPLIEAKFANSPPSGIDGMSFVYELFEFEGLKINDPDAVSNCTGEGTFMGMKSIEFGTWGIATPDEKLNNAAASLAEGLQGFPLTLGTPRFNCSGQNEYRMTLPVQLNLMSDDEGDPAQGQDPSTSGLNAEGELGFVIGLNSAGFDFKRFELGCLLIEGAFGPLEMTGGLNILRSDDADTKWGDGFKAFLDATVAGINVQAVAQFGATNHDQTTSVGINPNGNKYRYFFVDLEATSETGIPIGYPPVAKLYGLGGGFRYNMNLDLASTIIPEPNSTSAAADHGDNDNCAIDADLIGAGVSLSGTDYYPDNGVYGGYLKIIAGALVPQVFVGDLAVDVGIAKNDAGTMAFESISVQGDGYFQAKSVAERADDNVGQVQVNVSYTVSNKILSGSFGVKMEYPPVTPIITVPNPDFDQDYTSGQLDINFGNGEWGFKFGSWGDPEGLSTYEPDSKLQYNTAKVGVGDFDLGFKFYLQAGHKVDNIPPIAAVVPDWDNGGNTQKRMPESLFKSGNGLVMGGKMELEFDKEFGPFSASLDAGLGFDMSMIRYDDVDCGSGGIGMNNWYMQGQAYAYAKAIVDMKYKLPFKSGTIRIADLYAAMVLQAKFPNPSYFKGRLQARYSVLGGLLKGKANIKVEIGEQCEALANASPIAGIKMVADVYPNDGAEDVNIFVQPKLSTNLAIGQVLTFPKYDDEGNVSGYENYRAKVNYVKVRKAGTTNANSGTIDTETYGLTLAPNKILEPNTDYELEYHIIWEEDKDDNASFYPLTVDGNPVEELDIISFKTGAFPDVVSNEMLENQAPGYSQRFWHKNYANPLIRFNTNDSELANLFPESTTISGKEVRFEYQTQITEYGGGNGEITNKYIIPVVSYPGGKTFKKAVQGEISIGTVYKIPTVTIEDVIVNEVNFPELNQLNLAKGKMCKLEIIRKPESTAFATTLVETTGENGETITDRKINGQEETAIAEATKILYEYHFGLSKYDNLRDKLSDATVNHNRSKVARNDFNHPKEHTLVETIVQSDAHASKDEYFSFVTQEGFDKFDLVRIRKNARISYLDRYGPDHNINSRQGTNRLHDNMITAIDQKAGSSQLKTYLYTVLGKYFIEAQEQDGTYWNYNFFINPNAKASSLSSTEIEAKKIDVSNNLKSKRDGSYQSDVFNNDVTYGLLFQDLRSRILLNQMRWISHFGYQYLDRREVDNFGLWHADNKGPTEIYDNGTPSFSWVLPSDWNDSHVFMSGISGYKFNYHGRIKIEFPQVNKWQEMDSGVDINQYPKTTITVQPDHGTSVIFDNINFDGSKYFMIRSSHNGMALDNGGTNTEGQDIHAVSPNPSDDRQLWKIESIGNNQYKIISKNSNRALVANGTNEGDLIEQFKYNSNASNHFWKISRHGTSNDYSLINVRSDRIIETQNNKCVLWTNKNYTHQKFYFTEVKEYSPASTSTSVDNTTEEGNLKYMIDRSNSALELGAIDMKYEDIPKYISIFGKDGTWKLKAFWNKINNTLILNNNNNEIRIIPNVSFPEIIPNDTVRFDNSWVLDETGFRANDLYYRDQEIRIVALDDIGNAKHFQINDDKPNTIHTSKLIDADGYYESLFLPILEKHSIPFNGIYQNIPGIIEPANYDWGGPGVAYNDNDEGNLGGANRLSEGVDVYTEGTDVGIGWTNVGEWQRYSVNILKSGRYDVIVKHSGATTDKRLQLKLNGVNLGQEQTLQSTSGYGDFQTTTFSVEIPDDMVGIQKLTIHNLTNDINILKYQFVHVPPTSYAGLPIQVPGNRIEAEHFDNGGEGIAYHESDSSKRGNKNIRKDADVDIYDNEEASNGLAIGYCKNEWLGYTIEIKESKQYDIFIGYGTTNSSVSSKLYVDSDIKIDGLELPSTSSYDEIDEIKMGSLTLAKGIHFLKLELLQEFVNIDYLEIRDTKSTPYNDVMVTIPAKIEAENYDKGGEGVAYHEVNNSNNSGAYRTSEGVDVESASDASNGYRIANSGQGEWMKYTFKVDEVQSLALFLTHGGTMSETGIVMIDIDGVPLGDGEIELINTGGWNIFKEVFIDDVLLDVGEHVLTIRLPEEDLAIDYFEFKSISAYDNKTPIVPCRVEFEEFAEGGSGVGYYDSDIGNHGTGNLRSGEGVDLSSDSKKVGWIAKDEWLRYPIDVPNAGEYQLNIRYAGDGNMQMFSDGLHIKNIDFEPTGNTSSFSNFSETITLEEGKQIIKFLVDVNGFDLDYFEITPVLNLGVALSLDGTDDHIKIPDAVTSAIGGGDAITIEYWFKGANIQSAVRLQDGNGYIVAGWGSKNSFLIDTDGQNTNGLSLSDADIYDGEWHHIAMTWQRNTQDGFRLYLDGTLKKKRNSADVALPKVKTQGYIGSYNGSSERTNGNLDEVRIWNRALPETEIVSNMNCLRPSDSPGLVAYYNFDEKTSKNLVTNSASVASGYATSSIDQWTNSFANITEECATVIIESDIAFRDGNAPFGLTSNSKNFDLGEVPFDGEDITKIIRIENKGNQPLIISNFSFTEEGGGFSNDQTLNNTTIAPGIIDTLKVTYSRIIGSHTAAISFTTNDPDQANVSFNFDAETLFDGANRSITLEADDNFDGVNVDLNGKSFTIEFWAKQDEATGGYVVCQGERSRRRGLHVGFRIANKFRLGFYQNDLEVDMTNTTEWNHYAAVFTGTEQIVYQNGIEKGRRNSGEYIGNGNLMIGVGHYYTWPDFAGQLDELRIWNRALSIDEVNAWKSCKPSATNADLLVYYDFDNKTLTDKKSSENGTPNGFAISDDGLFSGSFGTLSGDCQSLSAQMTLTNQGDIMTSGTSTIDFGALDQTVGDKLNQVFVIKNNGSATLTISDVEFNAATDHFKIEQPEKSTLSPGETTTFKVIFEPSELGNYSANIKVITDAPEFSSGFVYSASGSFINSETNPLEWKDISLVQNDIAWGISEYNKLFRTQNGGSSWELVIGDYIQISAVDYNIAWAAHSNGHLYRTNNGGESWNQVPSTNCSYVSAIDYNTAWVLQSSGKIWKTNNGGTGWVNVGGTLKQISAIDYNTVWGVQSSGAIYRLKSGSGWSSVSGTLDQISAVDYNTAVGTNSNGNTYRMTNGSNWSYYSKGIHVSAVDYNTTWTIKSDKTLEKK